jgi:hypothetical protein
MLRLADIGLSVEDDIAKLQPDVLRSRWRHVQIQQQKHLCTSIDSTWRQKQVAASSESQPAFTELVLESSCSSAGDFSTDFGISKCGMSEGTPKWLDEPLACEIDKHESFSTTQTIPCLSGWLLQKKASHVTFMKYFSKWRKSWFVVVVQSNSLILNRYDGDAFSTPANSTVLDLQHDVRREQGLDGSDRFFFSVSSVDCKARIVLAGASRAQAENWVATLSSVMADMRAESACSRTDRPGP